MNIIGIDTSSNEEIHVSLQIDGKAFAIKRKTDRSKAQAVLPFIDELLTKHKLNLEDIAAIEVNVGPGSFTGLRVGVAIANSLGFLLHIPINEMPVGTMVEPVYS